MQILKHINVQTLEGFKKTLGFLYGTTAYSLQEVEPGLYVAKCAGKLVGKFYDTGHTTNGIVQQGGIIYGDK